jgi:hypothetical protein
MVELFFRLSMIVINNFGWAEKEEVGSSNLIQIEKNKNMVYFDLYFRKKIIEEMEKHD